MKRLVEKLNASEIAKEFPLAKLLPGWFFRVQETSAGSYLVEGTDLWGRTVSCQGGDAELLLQQCVTSARATGV